MMMMMIPAANNGEDSRLLLLLLLRTLHCINLKNTTKIHEFQGYRTSGIQTVFWGECCHFFGGFSKLWRKTAKKERWRREECGGHKQVWERVWVPTNMSHATQHVRLKGALYLLTQRSNHTPFHPTFNATVLHPSLTFYFKPTFSCDWNVKSIIFIQF